MTGRGRLRAAWPPAARFREARSRASQFYRLVVSVLALLVCVAAPTRAAVELRRARLGVTAERTRFVLELTSARFVHRHSAAGDTALVLRLPGVRLSAAWGVPEGPAGLFRSLRVHDAGRVGLEVRVSFTAPATATVFAVDAGKGKPARLVVDLVAKRGALPPSAPKPPASPAVTKPSAPPEEAAHRGESPPGDETVPGPAARLEPAIADSSSGPRRSGPRVVVLDPGHGGNDPGAVGKGLREKDVCLDVAKRLAAAINKAPGYRAVITRQDDRRVSLPERTRFAEREGADLFVSIHVNAARSRRAYGAEVFFLSIGAASDRAAAELARLENEADPDLVVDEDEALKGLPFAVDLRQSDTLLRSSRIAEVVLDALSTRGLAESRGVKQAGFAVLKSFQVPSILVETGFISSQAERKKLKSPDYRQKLSEALAEGIRRYFDRFAPTRTAP
jgi:N-acetylmuramoyl-L-alanine amidase